MQGSSIGGPKGPRMRGLPKRRADNSNVETAISPGPQAKKATGSWISPLIDGVKKSLFVRTMNRVFSSIVDRIFVLFASKETVIRRKLRNLRECKLEAMKKSNEALSSFSRKIMFSVSDNRLTDKEKEACDSAFKLKMKVDRLSSQGKSESFIEDEFRKGLDALIIKLMPSDFRQYDREIENCKNELVKMELQKNEWNDSIEYGISSNLNLWNQQTEMLMASMVAIASKNPKNQALREQSGPENEEEVGSITISKQSEVAKEAKRNVSKKSSQEPSKGIKKTSRANLLVRLEYLNKNLSMDGIRLEIAEEQLRKIKSGEGDEKYLEGVKEEIERLSKKNQETLQEIKECNKELENF